MTLRLIGLLARFAGPIIAFKIGILGLVYFIALNMTVASWETLCLDPAQAESHSGESANDDETNDDETNDDETNDDETNDDETNDDETNDDETNDDEVVGCSPDEIEIDVGIVGEEDIVTVRGFRVHRQIANNLELLLRHADREGLALTGWGWRSHQRQHELRRINGCPDGWTHYAGEQIGDFSHSSTCRIPTARPGGSMHETGLAIDFRCNGSAMSTRNNSCFRFLDRYASNYGLKNFPREPWHWSTNGR